VVDGYVHAEAKAADPAARFDIVLREFAFWDGSLEVIGKRLGRYLALQRRGVPWPYGNIFPGLRIP
jgi:hypothetical protein